MTWRPYLDLQIVQNTRVHERGIPRYATELCRALLDASVPVAAIALNARLPFPSRLPLGIARAPQLTWNTARALRDALEEGPTLYHQLAPFESSDVSIRGVSWLPLQVARTKVPIVVSVYDLIPEVLGYLELGSRDERFHRIRSRMLARADLLLAISEQTRRDVMDRLGVPEERVAVVGAGCSDYFRPPPLDESPDAALREHLSAIDRPYILAVSAWEPRKNTELLIDAFALLPRDVRDALQLVVACNLPPEGRAQWSDRARRRGLGERAVVLTGYVPDSLLRALYQRTQLFVDPSRYEGFGLPVLEAARCGAPSVVARAPGLQEVSTWEPARFDVDDPDDLATRMQRGVTDEAFRSKLLEVAAETARGHTWERVALRTARAYERLEQPAGRRWRRPSLRVALVGPFPPLRTPIAYFDGEVAERLAAHCQLDCFVESPPRRPAATRARWLPARALGRLIDPVRYDSIVYALGNSRFHHETLTLARHFPGIAWFHDDDLTGLYLSYARRLLARPGGTHEAMSLVRDVLSRYGARMPEVAVTATDTTWSTAEPYRRSAIRFTIELARDAAACLVPSERARAALELDAGPPEALPPVHVLPPTVEHVTARLLEIIEATRTERWQRQPKTA
jgi:glycosyltransferase involved in cell wall biosynthesis